MAKSVTWTICRRHGKVDLLPINDLKGVYRYPFFLWRVCARKGASCRHLGGRKAVSTESGFPR